MGFNQAIILAAQTGISGGGGGFEGAHPAAGEPNGDCGLECLPVLRWGDYAGTPTFRSDGMVEQAADWIVQMPDSLSGTIVGLGNTLWGITATLTNGLDVDGSKAAVVGRWVNRIAGSVYRMSFLSNMLIAIPFLITLIVGLWAAFHGRGFTILAKRFAALTVGLALFFTMGATAAAHPDEASPGTPWWMVETATSIVNDAGNGLNTAFLNGLDSSGGFLSNKNGGDGNLLSCQRYMSALDQTAAVKANGNAISQSVNRMWEETGLRLWIYSTYGGGQTASDVFCRILEHRAGADASTMKLFTERGNGGFALNNDGSLNENTLAFNPSLMTNRKDFLGSVLKGNPETQEQRLDRWVMMYATCTINTEGKYQWRPGFGFLTALAGKDRERAGTEEKNYSNNATQSERLNTACRAGFTGSSADNRTKYLALVRGERAGGNADIGKGALEGSKNGLILGIPGLVLGATGGALEETAKGAKEAASGQDPGARERMANLVQLFDVDSRTSNWQALIAAYGGGTDDQNLEALSLVEHMRGYGSGTVLLPSILFLLAGVSYLIVFGLGCGLMRMLSVMIACIMALFLQVGALVYAYSPDKGRRIMANAATRMLTMIAAPTLVALAGGLGCVFINTTLMLTGFIGYDGNNRLDYTALAAGNIVTYQAEDNKLLILQGAGTTYVRHLLERTAADQYSAPMIGVFTLLIAILPWIYVAVLRHVCIRQGIGDPFSLPGFKQLMGVGNGLKTGFKMAAGAIIGAGVAAATGGAGLSMLAAGMQGAMQGRDAHGMRGMMRAGENAMRAGDKAGRLTERIDAIRNRRSDADQAAVEPTPEQAEEQERLQRDAARFTDTATRNLAQKFAAQADAKHLKPRKRAQYVSDQLAKAARDGDVDKEARRLDHEFKALRAYWRNMDVDLPDIPRDGVTPEQARQLQDAYQGAFDMSGLRVRMPDPAQAAAMPARAGAGMAAAPTPAPAEPLAMTRTGVELAGDRHVRQPLTPQFSPQDIHDAIARAYPNLKEGHALRALAEDPKVQMSLWAKSGDMFWQGDTPPTRQQLEGWARRAAQLRGTGRRFAEDDEYRAQVTQIAERTMIQLQNIVEARKPRPVDPTAGEDIPVFDENGNPVSGVLIPPRPKHA